MNLVDDATGRALARLGTEETIWAAADVLRRWIEATACRVTSHLAGAVAE